MTQKPSQTGIVLSYQSNFYTVKVEDTPVQCFLKGILKKEGTDVLVGDRVTVDNLDNSNQSGRITSVLERHNQLSRPKIANITKAMVVASIQNPVLDLQQVDRYITHIQLAGIAPLLCISKADLADSPNTMATIQSLYTPLGIPVFITSIQDVESVQALFKAIEGELVVLSGPSGVGKSSLLNACQPGLQLAVGEVSEKIQRGQHTTRHVTLISVNKNTYVADTPGFSYLKFDTVAPLELAEVFPDFKPYQGQCRFDDCLHLTETDCAVRNHLDEIAPSRYASYTTFQEEAKDYLETRAVTSQKQEYGYKTLKKGKQKELQILKLTEKQRQASRRTQKQQVSDWTTEDDTLEEQ